MLRTHSHYSTALDAAARALLRGYLGAGRGSPDAVMALSGLTKRALYSELRRLGMTAEMAAARARALVDANDASQSAA